MHPVRNRKQPDILKPLVLAQILIEFHLILANQYLYGNIGILGTKYNTLSSSGNLRSGTMHIPILIFKLLVHFQFSPTIK